jgi:hypothetical protein
MGGSFEDSRFKIQDSRWEGGRRFKIQDSRFKMGGREEIQDSRWEGRIFNLESSMSFFAPS